MGKVFLVGAGPGDPELLTVRALRILKSAEVVVYDRLVSDGVLRIAAHALLIDGGKRHSLVGEDLAPFAKWLIGGDQHGAALVTRGDQLEQEPVRGLEYS